MWFKTKRKKGREVKKNREGHRERKKEKKRSIWSSGSIVDNPRRNAGSFLSHGTVKRNFTLTPAQLTRNQHSS